MNENEEEVQVQRNGEEVFHGTFQVRSLVFPVNTLLFPYHLVQLQEQLAYYTCFTGKGWGKIANVKEIKVNGAQFPSLAEKKPLAVIAVHAFTIRFPAAEIERIGG